jgi:IS5 family transposase
MTNNLRQQMAYPKHQIGKGYPSDFAVTLYSEKTGRPGIPIRTMAGLVLLQHTFELSDEKVEREWPEWPAWQFFCGEEFFLVFATGIRETKRHIRQKLPVDFSQISPCRKRIGKEGMERILKATIEAGLGTKTVTPRQSDVIVVDTTVQAKAVDQPKDARLYRKTLHHLLRVADAAGIRLRQSYRELAKSAFLMCGRYAEAKPFRRAARVRKKLKVHAGRVQWDLERKLSDEAWEQHQGTMILAELALTQEEKTKGKVYSIHAPEVECIATIREANWAASAQPMAGVKPLGPTARARGNAHNPYEFGVNPEQERRTTVAQRWPAGWRT